jgi:hypothetical protein
VSVANCGETGERRHGIEPRYDGTKDKLRYQREYRQQPTKSGNVTRAHVITQYAESARTHNQRESLG